MKTTAFKSAEAIQDNGIETYINCLEWLAHQAIEENEEHAHSIIKKAVADLKISCTHSDKNIESVFENLLMAFKFLVRFCLIEDEYSKRRIIELIDNINKEDLRAYASN